MKRIFKYELAIEHSQLIEMPAKARILSVGNQGDQVCLWAEVDPDSPTLERRVLIAGTGHATPPGEFIGTVLTNDGSLVWHVYDGGEFTERAGVTNE
jgi:hypothetical protein